MKNKYFIKGNEVIILCNGKGKLHEVIIDIDDFDKVSSQQTWYVDYDTKLKNKKESIKCHSKQINGFRDKNIVLHRFIMNAKSRDIIDHINGNILDNRKSNLRICSSRINCLNRVNISKSKSGHRNIYFETRDNKYRVRIRIEKNKYSEFGKFEKLEDAIKKRNEIYERYNIPWRE